MNDFDNMKTLMGISIGKVYLLMYYYEGGIYGAYKTKEDAIEALEKYNKARNIPFDEEDQRTWAFVLEEVEFNKGLYDDYEHN